MIFPVPVTLNLFLALEFVFTFGILNAFNYTFEAFPISRDPWRASSGNFVSLIEGRKDKGFELCNKSNFQKYPISNNTASVFDIILRIYAQVE
ncbi:MAG TPA: hypothetical protein VFD24_12255 [Chitinophagaceae bacterium]|nr:hypothetical protein [Chitinophagaceae bacterium]